MTVNGIDVSSYQSETYDTTSLAFVVVKRTEGDGYVNPKASAQVAHGRSAGLLVGHYHYPHIHDDADADADYFLAHLGSDLHAGDLIVLDWEWYGQTGVSAAEADAYKDEWLARVKVKAPGHKIGAYSDVSNWTHTDVNSNCGDFLWIATGGRPAGQPGIQHPWTIHQYSTAGGIDHDVANFADKAALMAWANPAQPKPPAPKPPAPAPKPKVSLQHIVYAARHDPAAAQGHTSYKAEVLLVEKALKAEGLLASQYVDGSFGSKTVDAYKAWQQHLGYSGSASDGIPGKTSLAKLGSKHGFDVVA
ncbi:GH25 family lysozyme [Streptomyces sp. NBC_01136]|uniref:GH25 family lysozyme n=1 Tax=Streptomyces sp. NBC_01136 TaxID=2903754 RepID=UPI00387064ED|nr:GH25 family lysozyme [Streptomyces sp. NBC_01136]